MIDLDELERITNAATPGPWMCGYPVYHCTLDHSPHGKSHCQYTFRGYDSSYASSIYRDMPRPALKRGEGAPGMVVGMFDYDRGGVVKDADAEFIARARTAVPELIARIRELEQQLQQQGDYAI